MQTTRVPVLEDPVHLPEFEQLVRELDEIIREDFRKELEPAIEDLVLARLARSGRAA
ncbi:MAG: hypothetical protein HZB56_23800 [Deltaproteobacteria bacterium]|nr:hypothetical protein [Deltaproteobacteria bacterium]